MQKAPALGLFILVFFKVLECSFDFLDLETFDHVPNFDIIEVFDANSTFISILHLIYIVFESLQLIDFTCVHNDTFSNQAHLV